MINSQKIYVLHKSGIKSHYKGLEYLAKQNQSEVAYREFSVVGKFIKNLFKLKFALVARQFVNAAFLLNLYFTKNKKVVLGIAPYDYNLTFLCSILKNHQLYYHTSWTVWDGSYYPKKKKVTPKLMQRWKEFIEQDTKHIFAVSGETRQQLLSNYTIPQEKVSIVYHSLEKEIFYSNTVSRKREKLKFIYAGRLVPQKGLEELLEYFSQCTDRVLTIAGNGELQSLVQEYAQKYEAVNYEGFVNDPDVLARLYCEHDYLLLNSKKTEKWEELFGMVIIEAMGCGVIPISTAHTGPKEIITHGNDGYLVKEGDIVNFVKLLQPDDYPDTIRANAIAKASQFYTEKIAERWAPVLL